MRDDQLSTCNITITMKVSAEACFQEERGINNPRRPVDPLVHRKPTMPPIE
jgi:hypothetical protein